MHPLNGALPGQYVPVQVTRGALITHWYTYTHRLTAEYCSTAGLLYPTQPGWKKYSIQQDIYFRKDSRIR